MNDSKRISIHHFSPESSEHCIGRSSDFPLVSNLPIRKDSGKACNFFPFQRKGTTAAGTVPDFLATSNMALEQVTGFPIMDSS